MRKPVAFCTLLKAGLQQIFDHPQMGGIGLPASY